MDDLLKDWQVTFTVNQPSTDEYEAVEVICLLTDPCNNRIRWHRSC